MPATSDVDYLKQAAADILSILAKPSPTLPYLQKGNDIHNAITKTAEILQRAVAPSKALLPNRQIMDETSFQSEKQAPNPSLITPTNTPTTMPDFQGW